MDSNKTQVFDVQPDELIKRIAEEVASKLGSPNSSEVPESLLSRKQAAEFLDISLVTLHTWVKNGILRSHKVANKVYFKRSELLEDITSRNSK